ncbi:hypothetical protein LMH87_000261 [Akanthomyces muscarius]|uniref:Uncharacterized protein n=1 Tax=Akanthomyces muscarius TaxID=2231603 RepID=A0A9W8QHK6_AKAMU|nr:hypothetical protein LMH87_000261 [Akanthomyces muscarius]KAJ4154993.1 hypothetical protein LMH87_000261 [Akanthomyces muscarius]
METQSALSEFRRQLEKLCQTSPDSDFYLRQLLAYVNNTPDIRNTARISVLESQQAVDLARGFPSLVIVGGHLAPSTIVQLTHKYNLRPELFLGHLEIERVQNRFRTSYELPALPSQRKNIIHVRLVSLWRSPSQAAAYPAYLSAATRQRADESCLRQEKLLFENLKSGSTRFRKVHLHSSRNFSLEQVVSFCLLPMQVGERQSWRGVYLIDSGDPLSSTETYPWDDPTKVTGASPTLLRTILCFLTRPELRTHTHSTV